MIPPRRTGLAVFAAAVGALTLAACGSQSTTESRSQAATTAQAENSPTARATADDYGWTERKVVDRFVDRGTVEAVRDLMERVHDATGTYPTAAIDFRQQVGELGDVSEADMEAAQALYVAVAAGASVCLEMYGKPLVYGESNHLVYLNLATNTLSTEVSCEDGL